MNKNSFKILATYFLLISVLIAGRQRQPIPQRVQTALLNLPFTELQRICNGQIVDNFNGWYPDWIIQYVIQNRYVAPTPSTQKLRGTVKAHIDALRSYLNSFEEQAKLLELYPRLYLKVEVRDLLSKISAISKGSYVNPYDSPETVNNLQENLNPEVDLLIDTLAKTPIDLPTIAKIGELFNTENSAQESAENKNIKSDIEELKPEILSILDHLLDVFAEPSNGPRYKTLSEEDKALLQEFYETFADLQNEDAVRLKVFQKLIGEDKKTGKYAGHFFGPSVFEQLLSVQSPFKPLFLRDQFILNYNPKFKLSALHNAAVAAYHTWEFPTEVFAPATEEQLAFEPSAKKPKDPESKKIRKIAKLHFMLYKVFSFARFDNNIPQSFSNKPRDVLKKLYRWIVDTREFDDPELDIEGNRVNPSKGYEIIFPADKFKRNFLPLLNLICDKLEEDCTMDLKKNPDRDAIFDKYRKFGNFEDLRTKTNIAAVLPPELIKQFEDEFADDQFKSFSDNMDDLVEKNPELSKPTKQDIQPKNKLNLEEEVIERPLLVPKKEVQKAFDDTIGNRFLPAKGGDPSPQQINHFKMFLDKIESTDNLKKKASLRTLLVRFLYTVSKKQPGEAQKLLEKTIPFMTDKLRHSFGFEHAAGLKNFLMMTLNKNAPTPYLPRSADEFLYHSLDVIYFVHFANEDHYSWAKSPASKLSSSLLKQVENETTNTRNALKNLFYNPDGKVHPERRRVFTSFIKNDPLFVEKLPSMHFFVNFLDFFEYYARISNQAASTYVNYHNVFISFYSFAARVRSQILSEPAEPYQYMLDRLEECLDYTERIQKWVLSSELDAVCQLSHRKYAEMYFFYKVYLLSAQKPFKASLEDRSVNKFNTHTRIFLLFASEYPDFGATLSKACIGKSTAGGEPLCVSWKVYNDIITYVHSPKLTFGYLEDQMKEIGSADQLDTRVNMINGLEAAYLNIQNSNMVDWEKVNFLFDSVDFSNGNSLYGQLEFKEPDIDGLANYLKRTYSKLSVDPHEATLASTVQTIMSAKPNSPADDALLQLLTAYDRFVPLYLKLFLQFSNTDDHFRRIARLLVDNGVSYDLIKLNDIKNDNFFLGLAKEVEKMDQTEALVHLHAKLNEKYDALKEICKAVTAKSISSAADTLAEFDPMRELLEGYDEELDKNRDNQETKFVQEVIPELISQKSKIEGLPEVLLKKESSTKQPQFMPTLVVENKLVKRVHAVTSLLDQETGFQVEETEIQSNEDSFSDLDLELDFGDDLKSTKAKPKEQQHLINGVAVDDNKSHIVQSFSDAMIKRLNSIISDKGDQSPKERISGSRIEQHESSSSSPRSRSKSRDRSQAILGNVIESLIKSKTKETLAPLTKSLERVRVEQESERRDRSPTKNQKLRGAVQKVQNKKFEEDRTNRFADKKLVL